jgi:hypothetical protein
MCDDFENTKHWLTEEFHCESAVAAMENRMIAYADRLREARKERLEQLEKFGPRAYLADDVKQLVLLRDGKEQYHDFTERSAMVVYCDSESERKKYGLTKEPADEDGRTYFVRSSPDDYGCPPGYSIRVSREEATTIKKRWREAYKMRQDKLEYGSPEVGKIIDFST